MKQFYTIITALMLALPTLAQAVEGIVIRPMDKQYEALCYRRRDKPQW